MADGQTNDGDQKPAEDLDLTKRDPPAASGLSVPTEKPYDPSEDRERIRGYIALALVVLLCVIAVATIGYVFFLVFSPKPPLGIGPMKDALEIVFSPIVGLVGAVTGFYFGEKSK